MLETYLTHTLVLSDGGSDLFLASKMFKHGRWQYTKRDPSKDKNHVEDNFV